MKKFFSFIAFAVTFCFCVSCEKEEFSYSDYFVKQGEVLTRSGDDFDPIFELSDNNVPILKSATIIQYTIKGRFMNR